jgi:phenylacetate-CoA ligase
MLRGRRNIERLKFLRRSQSWPRERLEEWQLEHANALLLHARASAPFYAERLTDLRLPLRSLAQMEAIPVLTKADIRQNRDTIRAAGIAERRFVPARTGGSTGEPMVYYWDKHAMDWNRPRPQHRLLTFCFFM